MKTTTLRLDDELVKVIEQNAEICGSSVAQEFRTTLIAGLPERKRYCDYYKKMKGVK